MRNGKQNLKRAFFYLSWESMAYKQHHMTGLYCNICCRYGSLYMHHVIDVVPLLVVVASNSFAKWIFF